MSVSAYPVHVDATLDVAISRWLWLVKWLLLIPHYVVLFFLWLAFVVFSTISFFAILITSRYPPSLFTFNVGVLRWSWRVAYYAYGALGTDRYPPFTLADVPDYPAHFDVEYPARLSRGLVLVKWWLLAIPHYVVVGLFLGGGTWAAWEATDTRAGAPGLVGVLVIIAAVMLLFTGRYPQQLFDFVLGMNRWALRVAGYAGLMTDEYPPFRLDMGGHEPTGTLTLPQPIAPSTSPAPAVVAPPAADHPLGQHGWTAARVVSVVIGSVLGLASLGVIGAGAVATWATNTQRDQAGYLTSGARTFATSSYALTSDAIDLGGMASAPRDILGTLRIRATSTDPHKAIFIGVGTPTAVASYLHGVSHLVVRNWVSGDAVRAAGGGTTPAVDPANSRIWTAHAAGTGTQVLTWQPRGGQWVVVVMNRNASSGVAATTDIGATIPDLAWIAAGLLTVGGILLLGAAVLIAVPVIRAGR